MKNRWLKMLSIFLCVVLIYNMLPLSVLASDVDDALRAQSSALPDDSSSGSMASPNYALETAYIVEEDISRRGEYSKEFVLNNGLRLATVYAEPVHYEDAGQWRDIDNTLKTTSVKGIAGYTNTAGVWQVYFPQQLSGSNAISLTKDGYTVSFGMAGELTNSGNIAVASIGVASDMLAASAVKTASAQIRAVDLSAQKAAAQYEQTVLEKHSSKLAYVSVYDNTEVVYDLSGNRLKESIVISKYNASLWGYRYNLNTGSLIPVLLEDNTIELRHPETEAVVMTMPAPFMVDANGEYSYDVDVSLVQKNGGYLLSYYVPRQWLASADRAWPVVLDPVVEADNNYSNIQDISFTPTVTETYRHSTIKVGYSTSNGSYRTYLRFVELPTLYSADNITAAYITLRKPTTSSKSVSVEVHKVNQPWTDRTISWGNNDAFNETIEDCITIQNTNNYIWDITDIVRGWYADPNNVLSSNTGMMFKTPAIVENGGVSNWHQFCSSNYAQYVEGGEGTEPSLSIILNNSSGLESYWDYTTVSAGRAGTGYVQNYSGNLVWVHDDMGFDGSRMPVSIQHIFNSSDISSNVMGLGYGWRTNYNQMLIYQMNPSTNTRYYIWEDGDGTEHYFYEINTIKYRDEDGLDLVLDVIDSGSAYTEQKYSITDKLGNKSYFDSWGRLTSQVSNQLANSDTDSSTFSAIHITYEGTSSNVIRKISQITDGAGRSYRFTYDANGQLNRIDYYGTSQSQSYYHVIYGYSNGALTTITYRDSKTAQFSYTNKNLMSTVTDVDGYKLTFAYNTTHDGKPSRVASVTESHGADSGSTTSFQYGYRRTTVSTLETEQVHYFNQWGNTISIQDDQGRGVFNSYTPAQEHGGRKNQQIAASAQQVAVGNMFLDSSFEAGQLWTSAVCSELDSSSVAYIGSKSMSFIGGGVQAGPFEVENGESVTFSAYLKSDNLPAVELELRTASASLAKSERLGTSDGWERLSVTYTNTSGAKQTFYTKIYMHSMTTVYVDCVQLEKDANANAYNLVQNDDFISSTTWAGIGASGSVATNQTAAAPYLGGNALKITGDINQTRTVSQTIPITGRHGDSFILSGWAKADGLPTENNNSRLFALQVTFNTASNADDQRIDFHSHNADQWQFAAKEVHAPSDFTSITVTVNYSNNAGTAYFDGIGLYQGHLGDSYEYDANGNLTRHEDVLGNVTLYYYLSNGIDLDEVYYPTGVKTMYTYEAGSHNVLTVRQQEKINEQYADTSVTTYTYDIYGNVKSTVTVSNNTAKTSSAEYTDDGNHLESVTDEAGNTTAYKYYANTGLLEWVQYPKDSEATRTKYIYDTMLRLKGVSTLNGSITMSAGYTYDNDQLASITIPGTTYTLNYGAFGLRDSVSAGEYQLAKYNYLNRQGIKYLQSLEYGNDDMVEYTYDSRGRVTKETYKDSGGTLVREVTYTYNVQGQVATKYDSVTQITTRYLYDSLGRLIHFYDSAASATSVTTVSAAKYECDSFGNVVKVTEGLGGVFTNREIEYDTQNRPRTIIDDAVRISYTYDSLGRITSRAASHLAPIAVQETITYDGSGRIHTLTVGGKNFIYTYDGNGNIERVQIGTAVIDYVYDNQNQLIQEKNGVEGLAWSWTYDASGNIRTRKEYAYNNGVVGALLDTVTYGYGNDSWGDLMTAYNGSPITYDDIGNVTDDGLWEYVWTQGRQLAQMSQGATTWSYTYDDEGLRTARTNGAKTYTYMYSNGLLRKLTVGNDTLIIRYGADARPYSVHFGNAEYFYLLNAQGDVIGLVNYEGTQVVAYTYDAWGNILSTTGTMASTLGQYNPLRYRSYVYDQETGLYYLQSRYYNPEWGRFINADNQIDAENPLGLNLFAYCGNNPVNRVDPTGEAWWHWALGAAVAVAAAAATVVTLGAFAPAAACTLTLMATSMGVSYATASTIATVAVATTTYAASMYVADAAFTSVTGSSFMLDSVFQGNATLYNAGQQLTSIATLGMVNLATMSPGVCFVAGTLVKAENGNVPIEQIQVGDLVWAWDEETGDVALKQVVETYRNQSDELIHVFINGEEIITTPEHPFYSPVKGWTAACKLRAGDILVLVNGEYVVVEKIQHEILEAPIVVYNFQVEGYHTYYVADSGVLVHNSCNHNSSWNRERRNHWKNTASTAVKGQDYGAYVATQNNIDRMNSGLAPIGWDGHSVQLHHWDGIANDFYNYSPVSRTLHQLIHWGK